MKVIDILVKMEIFRSKGEARKWIAGGGVSINDKKVTIDEDINIEEIEKIEIGKSRKYFKKYFIPFFQ